MKMVETFLIIASEGDLFPQLKDAVHAKRCVFELFTRKKTPLPSNFVSPNYSGLIILGDDEEITQEEIDCLTLAIDAQMTVLGICAGCQVISKALGGHLKKYTTLTDENNPIEIYFTGDGVKDPILAPLLNCPYTIQHHYYTCTVPPHGTLLAASSNIHRPHCEAFRVGKFIYGLQFHPEVSKDSFLNDGWNPKTIHGDWLDAVCSTNRKVLDAWVDHALKVPKPILKN